MIAWCRLFAYSLSATVAHVRRAPAGFFLNMLVLALTLSLPFTGATLLENLKPYAAQLETDAEISVFLKMSASRDAAKALEPSIRNVFAEQELVVRLDFVPRERALESLKGKASLGDIVSTLGANPLPDAYLIKLEQQLAPASSRIDAVAEKLKNLPNVERIHVDSAWIKRVGALMHMLRVMMLFTAAAFCLVVMAVAFNTVRLQLMAHEDEIALMRLVGATDGFVSRPFQLTGLLLGLGAGLIALALVALAMLPLNMALSDLAKHYGAEITLMPIDIELSALLLAASAALGWLGAALCVRSSLRRVD